MKIVTWNLMRPTDKTVLRNDIFHTTIKDINPDILVLTETNICINPGCEYFSRSTTRLPQYFGGYEYADGENRTTIYSKFPFGRNFKTADEYTSVCAEIFLLNEILTIYATIIGITGGKDGRFREDFNKQMEDIRKISADKNILVVGDFNISFSGYIYPSKKVQNEANVFFEDIRLEILTRGNAGSPDHIAISKSFIGESSFQYSQIAVDKKLTDHSIVTATLLP